MNMDIGYGELLVSMAVALAVPVLYTLLWKNLVMKLLWFPWRTRRIFESQGIKCLPCPSTLHGNLPEFVALGQKARAEPMEMVSHDIAPRILPQLFHWSKTYGKQFVFWFGPEARMILTEPEQAKEILSSKSGHYFKARGRPDAFDLIGEGLVTSEGEKWAHHRRIMNPAFFMEKLKSMTPTMVECTLAMLKNWDASLETNNEINVHKEFQTITADIIAHTAFGSSFQEGKQVFLLQREQIILIDKLLKSIYIPGSRFIPTPQNMHRWRINKEIVRILTGIIQKRMTSSSFGNDLLGLMMAANKGDLKGNQKNLRMGIGEIIDECKTFFFAGHETTSTLLTWTMLLLSTNPEWQERLRSEVSSVCGSTEPPTANSMAHLKLVGMVLNEALRLYPPAVFLARQPHKDMKIGDITIPSKTTLMVPIIAWHHDKRFWGPDADEFKPERFDGGLAKASAVAGAYMPFSIGPRNCIGQNFAMLEAKIVLSIILQKYRFRISPTYRHAPTLLLTLQPQYGMPIVFEKL